MRWIIKIILFPISLVLSILTAFLTFLLGIGTALLYLLMMFCIFGAIASFLQKEVTIGIEALIIGFLYFDKKSKETFQDKLFKVIHSKDK